MARRKRLDLTQSRIRSAITNGSSLLVDIDGRSAWMRRYRDLVQLHIDDLGGDDMVSESERRLVRRAAMLTLQCEKLDARFAASCDDAAKSGELELYQRTSNSLRRLLETLGLKRVPKDVTPTPLEYARQFSEGVR